MTTAGGAKDSRAAAVRDPDPVSILLGVMGAVGALLPLAQMANQALNAPHRVRARVVRAVTRLADDLRHMDVDLAILEDVVAAAGMPVIPFQLGSPLMLSDQEFRRYRAASDRLIATAARSIKLIHEVEGSLRPDLFGPEVMGQPLGLAADAQAQLNGLLRDPTMSVQNAILVLRTAMDRVRQMLTEVEGRLI